MDNKEKNFISAVIYVHNAENRIENFLKTIIKVTETHFEHSEIICVNDSSNDSSLHKIKNISAIAKSTNISVINMSYFHGLEAAMNAGVDMAIGDFVFEFDYTYLDFDIDLIMKIYQHSLEGFDIVSASADRLPPLTSRLFYKVFDKFTPLSYRLNTESFRLLSRRAINRVNSMNKAILYRKALYANCGLKTDNIKYTPKDHTRHSFDQKEKYYRSGLAVESLILFTELGYRFSIIMSIAMALVSVFMLAYSAFVYLFSHPVAGWTTIILFSAFAFLGLFCILTIIIRYLQILIDLVFRRKRYNFDNIEKLTK